MKKEKMASLAFLKAVLSKKKHVTLEKWWNLVLQKDFHLDGSKKAYISLVMTTELVRSFFCVILRVETKWTFMSQQIFCLISCGTNWVK